METIFSKIIRGTIPAYIIHENEKFIAFLDVNPLKEGHTLIVPKHAVDYIFDIDDTLLAEMHIYAKFIAIALKKAIPCVKIGMAIIGLEVPHAHIHLVPMNTINDLNFTNTRALFEPSAYLEILNKIKNQL